MNSFFVRRNIKIGNHQQGYMMIFALLLFGIFILFSTSLLGYTSLNVRAARISFERQAALYLAEAGVEKAISELNANSAYSGVSSQALGQGMYSINVSTVGINLKKITAVGYIPNSDNPKEVRTVSALAAIDAASVSFNYGVQVGAGGLVMDNNSKIYGNIFSNGNITGGNGSTTGDVIIAQGTASVPDEQWTVQNQDFIFGKTSSVKDTSQSFRIAQTGKLTKIQIYIKKVGNPGDLTVRMLGDNNGSPSKTVLGSANISSSLATNNYGWVESAFSLPFNLSAGVDYWLMLSPSSVSSANYYIWGSDSNNGYGNGVGKYSSNWNASNPAWNPAGGDFNYKIFMGGVATYIDGGISVGGNLRATEIRDCGKVAGTAYYDTVFNFCQAGSSVGLTPAPGPEAMPISQGQIDEWKNIAEAENIIPGPYTITGFETLGPVKINGDLHLAGHSILHLTGPVWVKGNITTDTNVTIRVDASLGNASAVLFADNPDNPTGSGIVNISNNTIIEGNGNPNSYPMIMTTSSDLTAAMNIQNNAEAAIYYASQGVIQVAQKAGGNQITGYGIHLNENAEINYQTGLQNALFSNGPGASWKFLPGSYIILP